MTRVQGWLIVGLLAVLVAFFAGPSAIAFARTVPPTAYNWMHCGIGGYAFSMSAIPPNAFERDHFRINKAANGTVSVLELPPDNNGRFDYQYARGSLEYRYCLGDRRAAPSPQPTLGLPHPSFGVSFNPFGTANP